MRPKICRTEGVLSIIREAVLHYSLLLDNLLELGDVDSLTLPGRVLASVRSGGADILIANTGVETFFQMVVVGGRWRPSMSAEWIS